MFGVAELRNKNESFKNPEIFYSINKQRLEATKIVDFFYNKPSISFSRSSGFVIEG
jgi:hypothetical protein